MSKVDLLLEVESGIRVLIVCAEDAEDDGADDEPLDPLVEALFDEIERMQKRYEILELPGAA